MGDHRGDTQDDVRASQGTSSTTTLGQTAQGQVDQLEVTAAPSLLDNGTNDFSL